MTPAQFLARIQKQSLPPAVLLMGTEGYQRRRIRQALGAVYTGDAFTQHDLMESELAEVLDDARALSLFASERLLWVSNGEAAMPRGRALEEESEGDAPASGDMSLLKSYMQDPTPGVVLVIEAIRFDFEGDDKKKQDRVKKFFAPVTEVVELRRYSADDARAEGSKLASQAGVRMEAGALDLLVEALGADVSRIAVEIEKLSLFAGDRPVNVEDITGLVPDARSSTIFALVAALGRRDRTKALEVLDTVTREGAYLPLALAFLSTQFRMALAAREANLRGAGQIQGHFTRLGMPVWSQRADQISQTVSKFNQVQLERALRLIYQADKEMRDAHPDDRTVMEQFILQLVK